jgi:hypothetical protein
MRIWKKNRWLSIVVAVGYVLTVTTASLFHNHAAKDGDGCCHRHSVAHVASADCHHAESNKDAARPHAPKAPARCPSDGSKCSVCQFLGHKPAPAAEVTPVASGTLVQELSLPAPASVIAGLFSAWQSRAPPVFA